MIPPEMNTHAHAPAREGPPDPLASGQYWTAVCEKCGKTVGVAPTEPLDLILCRCGNLVPYRRQHVPVRVPAPVVPSEALGPDLELELGAGRSGVAQLLERSGPALAAAPRSLVLDRPLVCFDFETTGIDPKECRIVEFCFLKLWPGGRRDEMTRLVDPGIPIPPGASAIHGITDDDVSGSPTFPEHAPEVLAFLGGCDLAGFNIRSYDLKVLMAELARCGKTLELAGLRLVDALSIYHKREPRNLTAAVKLYLGRDHAEAHGAAGDVRATLEVLTAQLERYPDLPRSVAELHAQFAPDGALDLEGRFRRDPDTDEAVFTFGKYQGISLAWVATHKPDYLRWMLGQDFFDDTKALIRGAL